MFKFLKLLQMTQLPCIKNIILGWPIISMTNDLTDMIFDDSFYHDPRA